MSFMQTLLQTAKLYDSEELQRFVLELETAFAIEPAREKYHRLVNFSENEAVPYHQWFRYREGFAGSLITELIRMSGARPGECVIDPFCGSGTTNVVAALSGFDTLGLDVNPMSAFLTGAKIAHYSPEVLAHAEALGREAPRYPDIRSRPAYEELRKYFSGDRLDSLLRIKSFLDVQPESGAKTLLFTAYLSILLDCSDRKRDGNGLKVRPSRVEDVPQAFREKLERILRDIREIRLPPGVRGRGVFDTACHLSEVFHRDWQSREAGAIIFSPPYANSFDYFESYKLELALGDFAAGTDGLHALRKQAVRSFVGAERPAACDPHVEQIAREIENAIPEKERETGRRDARTRKVPDMIRGYFSDMQRVLGQCAQCLDKGKKTYIVVDQSAYVGKIVPTDLLLGYLGEKEGFAVGRILECRRARTSTQQLNRYPFLKDTLRESIVELIRK